MKSLNVAARLGNLSAGITIVFVLLLHFGGVGSYFTKNLFSFFSSFSDLVFIVVAVYQSRKIEGGGYISFRNAWKAANTFIFINALLLAFFQYIYLQFIDVHFLQNFLEQAEPFYKSLAGVLKFGKNFDEFKEMYSAQYSPINMAWSSFSSSLFFETIIALVVAGVLKKEPPYQVNQEAEDNT